MPLATTKTTTTTSTPLGSYSSSLNTAIPAHASHIRSLAQDKYTLDEECEALQRAIEGSKRAQERARREYELKTAGRVSESGRWARVMGPNEQPIGGRARGERLWCLNGGVQRSREHSATGNKENEGMVSPRICSGSSFFAVVDSCADPWAESRQVTKVQYSHRPHSCVHIAQLLQSR